MPQEGRIWARINRALGSLGFGRDWFMIPLAAVVGTLGGVVATGFELLVEASGHFFFVTIGEREFPGSEWVLIGLLPAVGGLGVGLIGWLLGKKRPEHGVPEVIETMAKRDVDYLTPRSGASKAVSASLTMGSGGSAGVEGPIIMIGSTVGSTLSNLLRLGRERRSALIGCGAAAGTAAIFNAPIAGVLFVLEVILRDFSIKTFIPIVVASVFGTSVAQALLGDEVVFRVPEAMRHYDFVIAEIGPYALLGLLCGGVGALFAASMRRSEALWDKTSLPGWARPAVGGLILGLVGVLSLLLLDPLFAEYDRPAFYGNGYPVIEALLNPVSYPGAAEAGYIGEKGVPVATAAVGLLCAALLLKMLGTCLTLGSGGSGGIIAPSLFMGAALGAALAMTLNAIGFIPAERGTPATYALAGMAGMIAAVVHCPLTAFLLVFEITQDYRVVLPMMLVAILATTASQFFYRDSIYQAWLRKRGIRMGTYADMVLLRRLTVHDVPLSPAVIVHPEEPAQRLLELAEDYAAVDYVVCDDRDIYLGMIIGQDVRTTLLQREAIPLMIVGELMRRGLPTCEVDETLDLVLDKFSKHDVSSLAVIDHNGRAKGMITRSRLMRRYQRLLDE
ncbi:MAG: CBS domain-containing protein [Planctomycetes bacterium]|jgi:CIC family chloride channel protein|nr:CBS domain-containing protein [Planctomycetota bacterium]